MEDESREYYRALVQSLRRDVERLTKDRDAAYAASLRSDEVHAETVRAVRARAEKAEAERDEARAQLGKHRICPECMCLVGSWETCAACVVNGERVRTEPVSVTAEARIEELTTACQRLEIDFARVSDESALLMEDLTAARAQVERLRGVLRAVVEEHAHRCFECDAIATWREAVDRGGRDKFWCDEHVWIPQKAISKGALRYQPQRVMFADWFENARIALADATVRNDDPDAPNERR